MKTQPAHLVGRSAALLLLVCILNPQRSLAQASPGVLDPTFAGSGMARVSFGGDYDACRAVVLQGDGKILLAGSGDFGGNSEFELIRLGTNNLPDSTFGTGGVVLTPFFDQPEFADARAAAVAIQPDAKIVAAGWAAYDNGGFTYSDFALARYNLDGSLDNSFGSGGKVLTDFGGSGSIAAMVIQSDGKIVVAGGANNNFTLARYQTNGVLDTSFGSGGTVSTYTGGGGAAAMLLQPDGRLIVAGAGNGGGAFAVARYTTNGVLDSTFGGGVVYTAIPGALSCSATCAAYQHSFSVLTPDQFLVGGYAYNNSLHFWAAVRYNLDGTLDSAFGSGGIATGVFAPGATYAYPTAMFVQGQILQPRKISVAGYGASGGVTYFGMARLLSSGALDTTFGSGGTGMAALSFGGGHFDEAYAMAFQSGGYLLAGVTYPDTNYSNGNFAAARFGSTGLLDTTFGNAGVVSFDFAGQSWAQAVAVQPDGKILAAGGAWSGPASFGLTRYNADGSLDSSFGSLGRVTSAVGTGSSANAMRLQPDGRIVTAGYYIYTNYAGTHLGFALMRHDPNGSLDSSFGTGGQVTTTFGSYEDDAIGLGLQSDGKIVAVGSTEVDSFNQIFNIAVARYTTNGLLDSSFGGTGKIVTQVGSGQSVAGAVAIQSDGKIVVGGYGQVGTATNFALLRYNPDGSLDSSFGSFGRVTTDFGTGTLAYGNALALQADGKIILAGRVVQGSLGSIALARYTSSGALDSSFGTGGKVTSEVGIVYDYATAVAVMPNGKIVVAGPSQQGNVYNYAVLRYLPNGTLDSSYGTGGKVLVNYNDGSDAPNAVAIDQIGRAVVAGEADTLFGLARLASEPVLEITSIYQTNKVQMLLQGLGVPATNQTLLASPTAAPGSFSPLAPITPDAGGFWQYFDTNTASFNMRFYRLSLP